MRLRHRDGSEEPLRAKHTLNLEQIKWFQAGSALNILREQAHR